MYMRDEGIITMIIEKKLDDDEHLEAIIKVVDVTSINPIDASSMTGGTLGNLMVYGLFKNIYFTNKRIFFVDINENNEDILDEDCRFEEILDIRFTNNHIKVEQNDNGEYFIKEKIERRKIIAAVSACAFLGVFLLLYFHNSRVTAAILLIGILCCLAGFIIATIREDTVDEIEVEAEDGKVYKMLIAGEDYTLTKEYIQNRLEN